MNISDKLQILITEEEILEKVAAVARQLDQEYQGEELVILMVMKGAICLAADLIRQIHMPCSLEFIQGSSYGAYGTERGELVLRGIEHIQVAAKHVLVIDDIYDSGTTLLTIMKQLQELRPGTLKSLVLLSKKVERTSAYRPDYVLFEIENLFVVGYGLDYKEHYRGLRGIYAMGNA